MLQVSVPIAHELLAQYVNQGQALVQRASLVGDFSDYESWKAARKQWIEPTVRALEHVYGDAKGADDFKSAVTPSDGGPRWQQQYAIDLDCVKAAIELLTVLQGELAFARTDDLGPALPAEPTGEVEVRDEPHSELDGQARGAPEISPQAQRAAELAPDEATHAPDSAGPVPDEEEPSALAPAAQPALEPASVERPARAAEPLEQLEQLAEDNAAVQEQSVGTELSPAPIVGAGLAPHATGAVSAAPAGSLGPMPAGTKQVFLAHGRNEQWRQAVANLLERTGSHEIMILNERPTERGTLVEQFGAHAPGSRYAVVLLTADDVGAPRLESEREPYFSPRARQGVVFEMGFLVAALSPACVCVLYEDGVELPCDLEGIAYVRLDLAGTWQPKLLLNLRKAGFDYDLNRLAAV
jgi:predicted nucleotide-binding protein